MRYLNSANRISGTEQPERVMSLIDLSPSMDEKDWKPSRKAGAIKANIELIKNKAQQYPQDIVGIIGFGSSAKLLHRPVQLQGNCENLCNSLRNLPHPYGTDFTAALRLAKEHLFAESVTASCSPNLLQSLKNLFYEPQPDKRTSTKDGQTCKIIMLTDGEHNGRDNPIQLAEELKTAGVIIDCIGVGGTPADVDETILKQIASQNPDGTIRYCFIGDQETLIKQYKTLADHLRVV